MFTYALSSWVGELIPYAIDIIWSYLTTPVTAQCDLITNEPLIALLKYLLTCVDLQQEHYNRNNGDA